MPRVLLPGGGNGLKNWFDQRAIHVSISKIIRQSRKFENINMVGRIHQVVSTHNTTALGSSV